MSAKASGWTNLQQREGTAAYLGDGVDLAIDGQGGGGWTVRGQSADNLSGPGGGIFSSGHSGREGDGSSDN